MTPKQESVVKLAARCGRVRLDNQRVEGFDRKTGRRVTVPRGKPALVELLRAGAVVACPQARPLDTQYYALAENHPAAIVAEFTPDQQSDYRKLKRNAVKLGRVLVYDPDPDGWTLELVLPAEADDPVLRRGRAVLFDPRRNSACAI